MPLMAMTTALLTCIGLVQCVIGLWLVVRFASRPSKSPTHSPPVSVLKPLCGDEPLLEQSLTTLFEQDYPQFEIIFGLQSTDDKALPIVERLKRAYPSRPVTVVIDSTVYGPNRKVSNLINMEKAARFDLLVTSDSDLHVSKDYLTQLVAALEVEGTGLATALCVGLPANGLWATRVGACHISHSFLPGTLLGRALKRQDCLGTTVALTREVLNRVGGFMAFKDYLAEDNVLGQKVRALGLSIGLAQTIPAAMVPESTLNALWLHELRWARTIFTLEPAAHAASTLQYPIFWAVLTAVISGFDPLSLALFVAAWGTRALCCLGIDRALSRSTQTVFTPSAPLLLLPLRDGLSVLEITVSCFRAEIVWRGHKMCTKALYLKELPAHHNGNA